MAVIEQLISDNLDIWSSAIKTKSSTGRGRGKSSGKKREIYGIKKLRELILELAMRGYLVPQDPNDEPACELLKKIATEKTQLIKDKKIKNQKTLPPISDEEKPFELPDGWEWCRLIDVYDVRDGTHDTPKYQDDGYPLVTSKNLSSGKLDFSDIKYISEDDHTKIIVRSKVDHGDILFAMIGSIGNPVLVDTDIEFSIKNVALFKYYDIELSSAEFLLRFLLFAERVFRNQASGAVQSFVSLGKIRSFPIALPPTSEQHRIVAKVDKLMALCDQLEQQTETSLTAHQTLVETLLGALTKAANNTSFNEAWQRIAEHFDTLFVTEHSIEQLKQTILQLAVMGKLVPQDLNDEPTSELLKKIAAEKEQLINDKKIKKQKVLPPISEEEKPFELSKGWEWVRFFEVNTVRSELVSALDFPDEKQIAPDSIEKNTGKLLFHRTVSEAGAKGPNNRFYKGQLLYSKIRPSLNKVVVAHYDGLCSADMYPIICHTDISFMLHVMLSEQFLVQVRSAENRVKMPKLNLDSLGKFLIPLPPVSEQKRIITKVNRLMTLCDELKNRLVDAQTTQLCLADSLAEDVIV